MLSGPSFRSAFVFRINPLILSGFPLKTHYYISFFVDLYSCVCSCPKISRNVFYLKLFTFLVLILQSTCFICTTWKRRQTMENEWNKNKSKTKSRHIQINHTFYCSFQPTNNALVSLNDSFTAWRQCQMEDFFSILY